MMRRFRARLHMAAVVWALFLVLGLAGTVSVAQAAGITVNSTLDIVANDGLCTLREAITAANTDTESGVTPGECGPGSGADIITVPAGTYTLDFGSQLVIETDVTLIGAGTAFTIVQASMVNPVLFPADPGVADHRVFRITTGPMAISGMTIQHGNPGGAGGAIRNEGTLTVTDSIISNNTSAGSGGGIANVGGGHHLNRHHRQ